jgi:hypothetical protein
MTAGNRIRGMRPVTEMESSSTRRTGLDFSRLMQLEFGFRPNVTRWCGFGSAGVPPAVLRRAVSIKFAGGTPALPNPALQCEARGHRPNLSNRGEISWLAV